jgi:hypothetical protein
MALFLQIGWHIAPIFNNLVGLASALSPYREQERGVEAKQKAKNQAAHAATSTLFSRESLIVPVAQT